MQSHNKLKRLTNSVQDIQNIGGAITRTRYNLMALKITSIIANDIQFPIISGLSIYSIQNLVIVPASSLVLHSLLTKFCSILQ